MDKKEINKVFERSQLDMLEDEIIQTINVRGEVPFPNYNNVRFVSINEESMEFDIIIGPKRINCSLTWQVHLSNLSLLNIRKN